MSYTRLTSRILCAITLSSVILTAGIVEAAESISDKQLLSEKKGVEAQAKVLATSMEYKVTVKGFTITGQDIINESEILPLLAGEVGKEKTLSELETAAARVAKHFHDQGYLAVQAYLPEQEVNDGLVEIAVVIGRYGDIIIKNSTEIADSTIRRELSVLKYGNYVQNKELEMAALLAGDLPGADVKIMLEAGEKQGYTNIIAEVKRDSPKISTTVSANNWGSRYTGYNQKLLSSSINNLAHAGDLLSISGTTSGSGQDVGSISIQLPVMTGGKITLSRSKSSYELGEDFTVLDAHGTSYVSHIDWSYLLKRSRNSNLILQLGYDKKTMEDKVGLTDTSEAKRSYLTTIGISADSTDAWGGGGTNFFQTTWTKGRLCLDSTAAQTRDDTSAQSAGSFHKINYTLQRQQYLADRLSLQVALSGQSASKNLDSSEKFSLGGPNAVRAYPVNEASGDDAWLLTSELRWNLPATKKAKHVWQIIGFYDMGVSHINKNSWAGAGENRKALSGAGLGIAWYEPGVAMAKLSYAWKTSAIEAKADTDKSGQLWLQVSRYF